MPKIKVKPTPAQARLLQALSDYEEKGGDIYYFGYDKGRTYAQFGGYGGSWEMERLFGKPRASTVRKAIREGWLEERSEKQSHIFILSEEGKAVVSNLTANSFYLESKWPSALEISEVLRKRHPFPTWLFMEELRFGTAWGSLAIPGHYKNVRFEQRIDAFALHTWPSKKFQRWAYEIKVSRGDFLHEINEPDKRVGAMHISNYFYFAAPVGLIKEHELPDNCGLIEINEKRETKIVVTAPWREACDPYWALVASMGRALLK